VVKQLLAIVQFWIDDFHENIIVRKHIQIFFPSRLEGSFRIFYFLFAAGCTLKLFHGRCYVDRERIGTSLIE
jgi:hypothetical protein